MYENVQIAKRNKNNYIFPALILWKTGFRIVDC